jgi:hypothetical protein
MNRIIAPTIDNLLIDAIIPSFARGNQQQTNFEIKDS